ncbi:MAG TPA: hypothetical protein VFA26_20260, partial [Gemmataceae bacterium]|nr:hypothetical protein [Gemmataceae bacterium]
MPRTAVLTARPAPLPLQPETLRKRLAALRRRLRLVVACRGGGWLLTVLLATTAAVFLLDWSLHLPGLVRAVYLVGMLGGAGFIAYRYLFLPLREKADDLTLALRVEERYPHLNDCLASTVQFLEGPAGPGDSPAMRRAAVRQALSRAQGCDFARVIDSRGVLAAGLCAAVSFLALAAAVFVLLLQPEPGLLRTAFLRLANPFGDHPWPTRTQLEIEEYRAKIGRNEPFEVRASLRGVIPETATVVFRFEGKDQIEHRCDVAHGEEPRTGRLATRLEPNRVQRSFSFQVRANDAVSKWHAVKVLPPPHLVPLAGRPSPQVRLTYPAYTGLKPQALPDGTGNAEAVAGTVVRLRAAADRPLARAWIEHQPETSHAALSAFLGSLASRHGPDAAATLAGARELWEPIPAELSEDRRQFSASFRPWGTGSYVLHFEDEQHLRGSRLLLLNITPDPAPTVTLERPSASRDTLDLLPGASFPLAAVAEDPTFAVRSVWLEYRTHKDDPPRPLPLFDAVMGGEMLRRPLALLVGGPGGGALPTPRVRPKHVPLDTRLSLKLFRHFDGTPLKEGDVLTLQVCADDFDDVSVDKQPGRSHEVEIRVVTRNALDLQLTQEQAKVQQELVRLREQEREAMKKVAEAQARLKQNGRLEAEDVEKLLQAEQIQQQIRERVGDRQQGLRAEAKRILDSLKNNNVPRSAVQVRMEKVAAELDRLAREDLQQVEPQLTQARKEAESQDQNRKEKDRLARLEEQAKEKEKQAQTLERLAEERDQEAEKADADARNRDDGDPQKAPSQAAAKQKRQQAEKLRQQARAARKEAEALRQGKANPNALKDALAGAREHQEEVEKTLSQLLTDLEPFASTMEIKGEAKSILQEQRRLAKETEQLAGREDMLGKKPDELNEQQRAELERLKEEQQRLEMRTNELLQKMDKVAEDRREKDPQTADELRAALDMARKGNLAGRMQQSREQLGANNLAGANKEQQQTLDQLEKLVKELEDRREAELDRLAKKLREAEKELQELVDEQEKLQKKAKEAEKIADPKEREEELQRLARRQKELQKKAQEMAERLSRMRLARAKQTL